MTLPAPSLAGVTTDHLVRYLPHAFAVHASHGAWKCYRHFKYIGEQVRAAVNDPDGGRLIINMPPRHGKSEFLHFWVPVWYLDNHPDRFVISASHTARLSARYGRRIRNECDTNPFVRVRLADDSKAANQFNTQVGGGLITAGVDSGLTGWGGHLAIIDDPYRSLADAESATYRENLLSWWQFVLSSRLEPKATVILIHHRWTTDDLTGWLMEHSDDRERWKRIALPAVAEVGDPIGRSPGEALCPERYNEHALKLARRSAGAAWAPMFQQAPSDAQTDSAYPNFSQANIDAGMSFDPALPWQVSLDFNINPGMHAVLGQYDPMADRFSAIAEVYGPRMKLAECIEQAIREMQALDRRRPEDVELHVFGDPSGAAGSIRSDGTAFDQIVACYRAKGYRKIAIRVLRAAPRVTDRLLATNDALRDADGETHYRVHPRCAGLITDFRKVRLDSDGGLVKSAQTNDLTHFTDAEGYRVHYLRPVGLSQARKVKAGR